MSLENLIGQVSVAAAQANLRILEQENISERAGGFAAVPADLDKRVYQAVTKLYPFGLYEHQARAIQSILDEEDVCLATPTASGKSLVFMTAAADSVLTTRTGTILALYPAKALIQDQIAKWKKMVNPLGINVGFIDGGVPTINRLNILRNNRIILMTPDVLQAWLMGNLKKREVEDFMKNLQHLILDEAHIYSGVFGSNMAYLLRRVQAVSGLSRIISSTATIGEPEKFIERLTGRRARVFTEDDDTSPTPPKAVILAAPTASEDFKQMVSFIVELSKKNIGKFIAFGDSRRLVEMFVAAVKRQQNGQAEAVEEAESPDDFDESEIEELQHASILPYRAGYEEEDRRQIQIALEQGELNGVVATSGLELGIDIGEISTVVMLGTPPSVQAFRQRFGRVGRRNVGVCVMIDTKGIVTSLNGGLKEYLARTPEKGWLYLDNRYIQYTNALCAAAEIASAPSFQSDPYKTLPMNFIKLVNNELEPTENLPQDFFNLKQRAQGGAHYEFPVRNGIEKSFAVRSRQGGNIYPLGNLSHSQVLREGYPGAIYYYMAKPFRAYEFNFRQGEINVRREHYYTTKPIAQNMVFPKFPNGILSLLKSKVGFVAEVELQVSERVLGFTETRGSSKSTHLYQQGSGFSERPLVRMFETTGICWCLPDTPLMTDAIALAIVEAFCLNYGIHSRDIGVGTFHTNVSPFGGNNCKGICIYDATHGSLRLTQQLAENFGEIVEETIKFISAQDDFDQNLALNLAFLKECFSDMTTATFEPPTQTIKPPAETQDWVEVFAKGERVLYKNVNGDLKDTFIQGYRYTPVGLMYVIGGGEKGESIATRAAEIFALDEQTKSAQYNLYTGDIRQIQK